MAQPRESSLLINAPQLEQRRRRAGLSLSELARRVGVSPAYMSMIARQRRRSVSAAVYKRLVEALDLDDYDELLLNSFSQDAA